MAQPIHHAFVVTTPTVPGYEIAEPLGAVGGLGTGSGRTAKNKGIDAYMDAMTTLKNNAAEMGANAVVGLTSSTFGASHGGAFGDAVGVILMGTAVVIRTAESV